jgi:hypothetical protein
MFKNKTTLVKIVVAALSIASPLLAGFYLISKADSESLVSLGVWFTFLFGTPLIIICGLLTQYLSRKSKQKDTIFMMGWAAPAIIVCYYELFLMH